VRGSQSSSASGPIFIDDNRRTFAGALQIKSCAIDIEIGR
jgi:hypothetical protein